MRTQVGDVFPHPPLRLHRSAPVAVVPGAEPAAEAELVAETEAVADRRRAS